MATEYRRSKPKTPVWFFLILAIVVLYSSVTLFNQQMMLNSIDDDTAKAMERLKTAQNMNADLTGEKEALEDPAYLEKIAREDLGMTRQGELPYIYTHKQQ